MHLRNGAWKYFQDENGLLNLTNDPWEDNNLKEKEQTLFNQLKIEYHNGEKTVLPPIVL